LIDGDLLNNITYILWFVHILDAENPKLLLTLA
jgi:hypothetical protein